MKQEKRKRGGIGKEEEESESARETKGTGNVGEGFEGNESHHYE